MKKMQIVGKYTTKKVNIINQNGIFMCMEIQPCPTRPEGQVLQTKDFSKMENAIKWANKILGNPEPKKKK